MNISSATGGIVFVAIAVAWLFFAVPGMRDRGVFREARVAERRKQRDQAQSASNRVSALPSSSRAEDVAKWRLELENYAAAQDKNQYVAIDPRAWNPIELPAPQTGHNFGVLEQVEFADVVSISDAPSALSAGEPIEFAPETLDEILRRRRANG